MRRPCPAHDSKVVPLQTHSDVIMRLETETVGVDCSKDPQIRDRDVPYPKGLHYPNESRYPIVPWSPKGVSSYKDVPRSSLSVKLPLIALLLAGVASGSEFPDRECCDSVPPPPPNYHQATSTTTTTTPAPIPGQNTSVHTGEGRVRAEGGTG